MLLLSFLSLIHINLKKNKIKYPKTSNTSLSDKSNFKDHMYIFPFKEKVKLNNKEDKCIYKKLIKEAKKVKKYKVEKPKKEKKEKKEKKKTFKEEYKSNKIMFLNKNEKNKKEKEKEFKINFKNYEYKREQPTKNSLKYNYYYPKFILDLKIKNNSHTKLNMEITDLKEFVINEK